MKTPFEIRYNNIKLKVERLYKSAAQPGEERFPGLEDISFTLKGGECVHLHSNVPSANRLLLDALSGHIRIDAGAIWVDHQGRWLNLPQLSHRQIDQIQARTIGYLGQSETLRRESTVLDCVSRQLLELGLTRTQAEAQSRHVLDWVGLARRLWHQAPKHLTLNELHQVNLARTFAIDYSVIVIDGSINRLEPENQERLITLIEYRKAQDTCFIGRFDQDDLRQQICERHLSIHVPTYIPKDIPPIHAVANNIAAHSY
ncbi:phosphonate c-p lyase system protein [Leptolyngbya sp. Heron Island J]|uniref:ATP-binding cassette domain-containing protein n=1 Tax=Leptolyngbya sp. Heron Island J TaxID=1385935 RepID=UPI0003B9ADD9|nr:ATP-binding cassette domain-containing protein [Leptolyngbya sp. Heron Island J]ESA32340.1 phosphonate c-p lyase system protein [Leptolyngbya sp. Heron Island J]